MSENEQEVKNALSATEKEKAIDQMFEHLMNVSKEELVEDGHIQPRCYIMSYDKAKKKFQGVVLVPESMGNNEEKRSFAQFIRQSVKEKRQDPNVELLAVSTIIESYMKQVPKEDYDKVRNNKMDLSSDPEAKEVLVCILEKRFNTRNVTWEFMKTTEDEVVFRDKPYLDKVSPYDQRVGETTFGNFFVEGASSN